VVDASNVAHNSNMVSRSKAPYSADMNNVLILLKKLKNDYKFEDIDVIAFHSLRGKAKNLDLLNEIKTLCKDSEAPPGTPADLYLIKFKKQNMIIYKQYKQ
jgi:hypothetical protein